MLELFVFTGGHSNRMDIQASSLMSDSLAFNPKSVGSWLGFSWEKEKIQRRISTDTLYIHHMGRPPGITWQELSELHYQKVYIPRYQDIQNHEPYVFNSEPHSGHYRMVGGIHTEVFYTFHQLIRVDGSIELLLLGSDVGWHCSNWDENMRSNAICLDGDYSNEPPNDKMIYSLARLVSAYSKHQGFAITRMRGHRDTKPETISPGAWFYEPIYSFLTGREFVLNRAGVKLSTE